VIAKRENLVTPLGPISREVRAGSIVIVLA